MHRDGPNPEYFCTDGATEASISAPGGPKGRVFLRRRELSNGSEICALERPVAATTRLCESVSSFRLYISGNRKRNRPAPYSLSVISTIPLDVHHTRANMEPCT